MTRRVVYRKLPANSFQGKMINPLQDAHKRVVKMDREIEKTLRGANLPESVKKDIRRFFKG